MLFPRSLSALIAPCALLLFSFTPTEHVYAAQAQVSQILTAQALAAQAQAAPTPTETKLYIVPGGPVYAGKVVNFKAWVSESGAPVKQGVVYFCDASAPHCSDTHILAQVQLRSSGTAEVNLIPPRGTHEVQAVFQGTKTAAASKSPVETLVVTGPQFVTTTTMFQLGLDGGLVGTVLSFGAPLSGYMDFLNASDGNGLVDEQVLGPPALTLVQQPADP